MRLRFLHAADIHLDSPMKGLERYEGAPVEEIRGASRRAFENLVALALDESVDFVLIAGDLYDGDWRDYNTGLFFTAQAVKLTREGIRVVVLRGNHDAASSISRRLRMPQGVFEFGSRRAETHVFDDLGVALHGQSYGRREVTENLAASYPEPHPGHFNIGLLHTALDGRAGHDTYAPCKVDDLVARGYDYWALGHVHAREVVRDAPWIVFPGNLQGRHARETGEKGATLVEVADGDVVSAEHRVLDVVRWANCQVVLEGADSTDAALDEVRAAVADELERAGERLLAVRVRLTGRGPIHETLARGREGWVNECRAALMDLGEQVWLEKVEDQTRTVLDIERLAGRDDPVGGLLRSLESLREDVPAMAELAGGYEDLAAKLPAEFRAFDAALDVEDPAGLRALLDDSGSLLLSRLLDAGKD